MEAAARTPTPRIRVLVVDDQELFVAMLETILTGDVRIEVVGTASDGAEAVELARELEPDIVLMDISMPGMDGIEATKWIREGHEGACVIVLSGSNAPLDIDRARRAGAASYVTKDHIGDELIDAIIEVASR